MGFKTTNSLSTDLVPIALPEAADDDDKLFASLFGAFCCCSLVIASLFCFLRWRHLFSVVVSTSSSGATTTSWFPTNVF